MAIPPAATDTTLTFDLSVESVRELNRRLHEAVDPQRVTVANPGGRHSIAVGIDAPHEVEIAGHVGYYCAGMNKQATVRIHGTAGVGLAENMMSGLVICEGNASGAAGATAHGGLLHVRGDASSRCGISMKGVSIVVEGSVGHMSAFMAQSGVLVVCGDAGDALGDSIYEAHLYVRGKVEGLGADCIEKELGEFHRSELRGLLDQVGRADLDVSEFRRYGSARKLYNFHVDHAGEY